MVRNKKAKAEVEAQSSLLNDPAKMKGRFFCFMDRRGKRKRKRR
jgi:hypothetical protein